MVSCFLRFKRHKWKKAITYQHEIWACEVCKSVKFLENKDIKEKRRGRIMHKIDKMALLFFIVLGVAMGFLGFCSELRADSTIKIQYGLGFHPETYLSDKIRSVNVGYYTRLEKSVSYALTAGYLGDKTFDLDTGYACAQFGTQIRALSFLYVDNYFGPCYFHEAHGAISGHLQFATNIGTGWRDKNTGSEIGINWKHFSNAGLSKPNLGLDLIMLSLGFGF